MHLVEVIIYFQGLEMMHALGRAPKPYDAVLELPIKFSFENRNWISANQGPAHGNRIFHLKCIVLPKLVLIKMSCGALPALISHADDLLVSEQRT